MPGIAGIIRRQPATEGERIVKTMLASMRHESFYTGGTFSAPELGIYAGGWGLENSFAAAQVFENEAKDIALIFCGECFAEPEVKTQLRRDGHQFADTGGAWLVHLYEARAATSFLRS